MKVAFVHKDINPNKSSGGFSRAYLNIGKEMTKLGHEVFYMTKNNQVDINNDSGIFLNYSNQEDIKKIVLENNIDILETPSWGSELYKYNTSPYCVRVDIPVRYYTNNEKRIKEEEYMVAHADGLIGISNWCCQEWGSITGKYICRIPYGGIKEGCNSSKKKPNSIVWVGKATWMKGIDILANYAPVLKSQGYNITCILTRINNTYEDLVSIKKLIYCNVKIVSDLSQIEYNKILSESQYILSTARKEGFCLAVMEGINQNAIPIIPWWVGGTLDFVNNKNGIIYQSVNDIIKLLKKDILFDKIKVCTWENTAKETLKIYEKALG